MQTLIRGNSLEQNGEHYRIYTGKNTGIYLEIFSAMKNQLDVMLMRYSRVLFVRLDIRPKFYRSDNTDMSMYLHKLKKKLTKDYQSPVAYLWAREQNTSDRQHYHLILILNAHKVRHPAKIIKRAETIAEGWEWPKPFTPKNCYYLIKREDKKAYRDALYRGSYLAKAFTKSGKGKTAHNYGRSKIAPLPLKNTGEIQHG
jgi:hypothetical protein